MCPCYCCIWLQLHVTKDEYCVVSQTLSRKKLKFLISKRRRACISKKGFALPWQALTFLQLPVWRTSCFNTTCVQGSHCLGFRLGVWGPQLHRICVSFLTLFLPSHLSLLPPGLLPSTKRPLLGHRLLAHDNTPDCTRCRLGASFLSTKQGAHTSQEKDREERFCFASFFPQTAQPPSLLEQTHPKLASFSPKTLHACSVLFLCTVTCSFEPA